MRGIALAVAFDKRFIAQFMAAGIAINDSKSKVMVCSNCDRLFKVAFKSTVLKFQYCKELIQPVDKSHSIKRILFEETVFSLHEQENETSLVTTHTYTLSFYKYSIYI